MIIALLASLGTLRSSLWSTPALTSPALTFSPLPTLMPASLSAGFWRAPDAQEEPQLRFQIRLNKVYATGCLEPEIFTLPFSLTHLNRLVTGIACWG